MILFSGRSGAVLISIFLLGCRQLVGQVSDFEAPGLVSEPAPVAPEVLLAESEAVRARIAVARAQGADRELGRALVDLADLQRRGGDWFGAVRHLLEAADLLAGDLPDQLVAHLMLGRIYWEVGDYAASELHHSVALDLAKRYGDLRRLVEASVGLVAALRVTGKVEEAERILNEVLPKAEELGDPMVLAVALNLAGIRMADLQRHAESLALHRRARSLALAQGLNYPAAHALYHMGKNLRRLNDPTTGDVLAAAYREGEQLDEIRLKRWTAFELSRWFEDGGDPATAMMWLRRHHQHRNEMDRRAGAGRLFEMELRHQLVAQEVELEAERMRAAEAAAQLQRIRAERRKGMMLGAALFIAMGSIAFALYYRKRIHKQALVETRRARDEAARADALKSELLRVASHDLKNPIGNVILAAEALRGFSDDAEAVEIIELLTSEANRMTGLVHDLLDHAALELGRLELHIEEFDLQELAAEVAGFQRARAAEKQQDVRVEGGSCRILADRDRLRQVLENLVSNGLKFGPPGSVVHIDIEPRPQGAGCRITVRDEGPGLSLEDRERLFAPFRRLTARPTGREHSTGLGLAIVQQLVRLHGGQVGVMTTEGEAGTTFYVDLPLRPPPVVTE